MRWLGWLLGLAAVSAIVLLIYVKANEPIAVNAAIARRGRMENYIEERAKTRLPKIYRITMPSQGRVLPIDLKEGSRVTEGQVIAQLDPKDLSLSVAEAEARVARIEAEIAENDDVRLEESALKQTYLVLESVEKTVEAAREQTQSSQARYDLAETEYARERRLYEQKAASKEELQRAEVAKVQAWVDYQKDVLSLRSNEAIQKAAEIMPIIIQQYMDKKSLRRDVLAKQRAEAIAQFNKARLDQERGAVKSPIDGVVLQRHVTNARVLPAGELLLELGRLEELEVEAEILSEDVVNVQIGDEVEIYGEAIGPHSLKGTVERIYPAGFTKISSLGVEQQRVLVIIAFDRASPEQFSQLQRLGPDYRVRVRIITDSKTDAVTIPRTALIRTPKGEWQVYVIRDGRVKPTAVQLGLMNDREAEIVMGIEAGDTVILAPDASIRDGEAVRPVLVDQIP